MSATPAPTCKIYKSWEEWFHHSFPDGPSYKHTIVGYMDDWSKDIKIVQNLQQSYQNCTHANRPVWTVTQLQNYLLQNGVF